MSKLALACTSLIAAIPGAFLGWVLVSWFLDHFSAMAGMVSVVAIASLLLCVVAVLLPPGILIFGPKAAESGAKGKEQEDEGGETSTAVEDAEESAVEDEDFAASETMDVASEDVLDPDDLSSEAMTADAIETFDVEDDELVTEDDEDKG